MPFDLAAALITWRASLRDSAGLDDAALAALETRLLTSLPGWMAKGLTHEEAFWLSARRLAQEISPTASTIPLPGKPAPPPAADSPFPAVAAFPPRRQLNPGVLLGFLLIILAVAAFLVPAFAPAANPRLCYALGAALLPLAGFAFILTLMATAKSSRRR